MTRTKIDLPGKLLMTWFVSGALSLGGALVTYLLFSERISHLGLEYTVGALYILGGCLGAILSGALGMVGRPLDMSKRTAFQDQLMGLLYTIPLGVVMVLVALWMALTYWAVYTLNLLALGIVTIAWLIFVLVIKLAIVYGWFGLRNSFLRTRNLFYTNNRFQVGVTLVGAPILGLLFVLFLPAIGLGALLHIIWISAKKFIYGK